MKSVLIISFSVIHSDPRVMRQVRLLEQLYKVTVAGFGPAPEANIEFIMLDRPPAGLLQKGVWAAKLLLGAFQSYYWNLSQVLHVQRLLSGRSFDLVLANDISALPVALELAGPAPVMIDAHEYSPREFEDRRLWNAMFGRYYDRMCKRYLPRAAAMTTVCQGIADEYSKNYGVTCKVIHNAPLNQLLRPSVVAEDKIRLIHHGAAIRSRHLGVMIEMMKHLDARFTLDFMLVEADAAYMAELRAAAQMDPRIRFIEPVAMQDICQRLNEFDVGVYLLPPVNFNHEHALPNKFFEFIQARLVVAIGPSPEMATLLRQYGCGVVAESFEPQALAAVLQELDAHAITGFKQASDQAAADLNYERGGRFLLSEVERLA